VKAQAPQLLGLTDQVPATAQQPPLASLVPAQRNPRRSLSMAWRKSHEVIDNRSHHHRLHVDRSALPGHQARPLKREFVGELV
jgi:hypothetical protein